MKVPFMNVAAVSAEVRDESLQALTRVYDSGNYILGPEVSALEQECQAWFVPGSDCIGVSSGTDALVCALRALGIGPGQRVLTTPLTFFATASAIGQVGAQVVFADVDPVTYLLDSAQVEADAHLDAILAVHLFGSLLDTAPLRILCPKAVIVEDAAQAWGAVSDGKRVGSLGEIACFSFFPAKPLGGCGDGGLVVTNDSVLGAKCRRLRIHGRSSEGVFDELGGNYRLDELQAALLRVRLRRVETWLQRRRRNARIYAEQLSGIEELSLPVADEQGHSSAWSVFSVRVKGRRDELRRHLTEHGVGTAVYYPKPAHLQPAMVGRWRKGQFPIAEGLCEELLALPIGPELGEGELTYVAECVSAFFRR